MKKRIAKSAVALLSGVILALPVASSAATVTATIEDFENYDSGVGAWAVVDVANVLSVQIGLGLSNPIQGAKALLNTVGVALPGGTYTIENMNLNMAVPELAEEFRYSMKSLVALNLGRTVTITLRSQNGVNHVSPPIDLATLIVSTEPTDVAVKLSDFTPPVSTGGGTVITGVKLKFDTALAGIAGVEQLDSLVFSWESAPASAEDWLLYQ